MYERVSEPGQWRPDVLSAREAVAQALSVVESASAPVVIADTQAAVGEYAAAARRDPFPKATWLRADARPVHEAGGSEAQEIAVERDLAVPMADGSSARPSRVNVTGAAALTTTFDSFFSSAVACSCA